MKKKMILRALLGFPLGIFINTTLSLLVSLGMGEGVYYAVVPQLAAQAGGEVQAAVLQYALSGLLGAACAGASGVWEIQEWSLLKRTLVHYLITTASFFPVAWVAWWMPHTLSGAAVFFGIFFAVYSVAYAAQYLYWKRRIRRMNCRIQQQQTP